ncbi:MAG: hypothetical protein AAF127_04275 [Pseudomonadota bacterium]
MQRTVTGPADLSQEALADLKGWLGISRSREDALLTDLLAASLAICEGFTGQTPLEHVIALTVPAEPGWQCLAARPVRGLEAVEHVAPDGARVAVPDEEHTFRIEADGTARLAVQGSSDSSMIAVTVRAGIAPDWAQLPAALKQGIIRLAAFHYRDRESGRDATPPASVTALWRPWRVMRLT